MLVVAAAKKAEEWADWACDMAAVSMALRMHVRGCKLCRRFMKAHRFGFRKDACVGTLYLFSVCSLV